MLNEEKIKHMTKAAAYETGAGKKNIKISSYFRADYLGLQLVKSAIAYTVAFIILAAMCAMGVIENLMLMISRPEYFENITKLLVILYIAGLVMYEIAIYIYYTKKYRYAKKSVKGFYTHLKHIHKFYETLESVNVIINFDKKADGENTL